SHQRMLFPPLLQQLRLPLGWALAPRRASFGHVGEFEAIYRNPARRKAFSHLLHERTVHRRTGTVRQNQRCERFVGRPRPEPGMPLRGLRVLTSVNTGKLPFPHPCPRFPRKEKTAHYPWM